MKRFLFCLLPVAVLCPFCKEPALSPAPEEGNYIKIDVTKVEFDRLSGSRTFEVDTNVDGITCKASASEWCEATFAAGTVTIEVTTNEAWSSRSTTVHIEGKGIRRSVSVSQDGKNRSIDKVEGDVLIPVVSSSVMPAAQSGEGIEKSHDGLLSTIYHSNWNVSVTHSAPVTLTYNFAGADRMDYIVYNPRTEGTNGNFKEFDLWVATAEEPAPRLYGSYDFEGSGAGSIVTFSPALENPTQIRFVVKSGTSDSSTITGFASCAEMQFFRRNSESFDYSTVFTDMSCSELKEGIGKTYIDKIESDFFRDLALRIFDGTYDSEFRVQEYRAWEHPDVMAAHNKSSGYSLRDNPTGMYARRGEQLIVLAGELHGRSVSLFIQDPACPGNRPIAGTSYTLKSGVNKIEAANDGLIYVLYHTRNWTGNEPEIKINIATGYVNGYFDTAKHKREEWTERLAAATFQHFDLVGRYAHLTFQTEAFRQYTPDGTALAERYDDLVMKEMEFMGLAKYNRTYNNRLYFAVMTGGWMVAGSNYTGYVESSQSTVLQLTDPAADSWGPAHEAGHINMIRPSFNWTGMGEVSNNVLSQHIRTSWGTPSRLLDRVDNMWADRYEWAFAEILDKGICYNTHSDVFCKLVPFWQLKLYMHNVLGRGDFYGDLCELLRQRDTATTGGAQMIEFVKAACDAAELDLSDFFTAWGFLLPVDVYLQDYSSSQFTVTAAMVNEARAYIATKGYPAPEHRFERIRDDNLADFK